MRRPVGVDGGSVGFAGGSVELGGSYGVFGGSLGGVEMPLGVAALASVNEMAVTVGATQIAPPTAALRVSICRRVSADRASGCVRAMYVPHP